MAYPETPGYQKHSATSKDAARRLTSQGTMEKTIFDLLDVYDHGWTCDELHAHLTERGHSNLQAGTVAARLRGLELKGAVSCSDEERLTRNKRRANVWYSTRLAIKLGKKPAPNAPLKMTDLEAELTAENTKLRLQLEEAEKIISILRAFPPQNIRGSHGAGPMFKQRSLKKIGSD